MGKISSIDNQTMVKKSQGGSAKKKEGRESVVIASVYPQVQAHMAFVLYYLYPYIVTAQYQ